MISLRKITSFSLICLFAICGTVHSVAAQSNEEPSGKENTFQVSFVPGVSTSDSYSTSQVSINILGGYNGAFHGFEIGSIFNGNRYDVSGLQMSGLVNMTKPRATAVLLAGALNLTGYDDGGVNARGLVNVNRNAAKGILLAGSVNYARRFTGGLMASGALNISRRETNGALLSGGLNIVGTQQSGLMMAGGLNLA